MDKQSADLTREQWQLAVNALVLMCGTLQHNLKKLELDYQNNKDEAKQSYYVDMIKKLKKEYYDTLEATTALREQVGAIAIGGTV